MILKVCLTALRAIVLIPAFYLAYVVGSFFAILMSAPSEIGFYLRDFSFEQLQYIFIKLPKSVILLSVLLLGVPFVSELTGIIYIYTGNKKHFLWAVLFVAWKVFLILWIGLVGGKGV
jgi:hypothetical protein